MTDLSRPRIHFFLLFALMIFLFSTTASADEVVVKNGDRLRGEVGSMTEKRLLFKTTYAGDITINWSEVQRIIVERPFDVTVKDEKPVRGEMIVSPDDGVIAIKLDPSSPRAVYDIAQITKLEPVKELGWETMGHLTLGLNVETGNTDKKNFHFDGDAEIAKLPHRIKLFAEATVETNDNVKTDNKQLFQASYNYFLTEKWFALTDASFQRDEFADLEAYGIATAGVGYQFWRSSEKNLSVSLAPGYAIQRYSSGQSFLDGESGRTFPVGVWSLDFDIWLFRKSLQFFHYDSFMYNFEDSQGWIVTTRTGIRIPLFWKLFANLQYNFKYDNQPADGKVSDDGKFVTSLGLKW